MDPYEKFQPQAVKAIVKDFTAKPNGRFLLVIPTGGGKTFTAMRGTGALFASGILIRGTHRAVWVAHREELLDQARAGLKRFNDRFPERQLQEGVDIVFSMMAKAKENIQNPKTKFVVFDEAHHGAAPRAAPAGDLRQAGRLRTTRIGSGRRSGNRTGERCEPS